MVVEEQSLLRRDLKLPAGMEIDCWIRLTDAEFTRPCELLKATKPFEFLVHVGETVLAHIGEDRRFDVCLLQGSYPAKHFFIERRPHEHIGFDEYLNLLGREGTPGIIGDVFPVGTTVQMSLVVGVTMPPVVMFELRRFEAGQRNEFALRFRIFRIAENFPVIEDHRVDGHEISCQIIDLELRRARKLAFGESRSP